MDKVVYSLFADNELRCIAQGSPCAFEAWLFVTHSTSVSREQQANAILELQKRELARAVSL